ncbi:Calx-beta domain-containing protein [Ulvibacterium sp.]|uniref:Ig-like domain-containing protein n=1 Tax=Ulvibacterium sp. TaxID=2665914 RepID=UPI003CC5A88C
MRNSTLQVILNKKFAYSSLVFFIFSLVGSSLEVNAQGISSGVTFNWADTQSTISDPANLESITINGTVYNTFVVPSSYELTRLGPGGHNGNNIWRNGTEILGSSGNVNWNTRAIEAYQSLNLNHYFESNSNGDNFCGDFNAATTTDSQIQTIRYSPGIPSNPDGILAVTERGGNNCQYLELYGIPSGGGSEQLLGRTFVRNSGNLTGVGPQAPPTTNSDYWSSGRNNQNGQIIGIALFELSDVAPVGSTITSIRYIAATHDNGDGKFFLMQTYAVDDIFESEFREEFNGDVGANDNVPENSSYSYFASVQPLNGTVNVNVDGTFTYIPDNDFVGTDVFEVQVCLPAPNQSVCNTSTVTLTVKPDNLPTANDDSYTINEDQANNTFDVLDNDDFGLDGPQDNNALEVDSNPSNGTATVNNNGTPNDPLDDYIVYTPNPYYNGLDSLVYKITDANGTVVMATVNITVNPDTTKSIEITTQNITVAEDIGLATVTVQIRGNYQVGPTIAYRTIDNTAISGQDFIAVNSNHTFAGNDEETFSFTVPITDDNIIEPTELLNIEVTSSSYQSPVNLTTSISILDNDAVPGTGISFASTNVTVTEGTDAFARFTVNLNGDIAGNVSVDYATIDGSATDGSDFTAQTGTITFTPTSKSFDIDVPILDDSVIEPQEAFSVQLSNIVSNLGIGFVDGQATNSANGNINDDDAVPGTGISFASTNVTVTEGTDAFARFTVNLNGDIAGNVSVDYATIDGSATDGSDFTAQTGTITFTPTSKSFDIDVPILDDSVIEPQEAFSVQLSNIVSNLGIGFVDGQATNSANGNINDDDAVPGTGISFASTNVTVTEGTDAFARFTVNLNGDIAGNVSVDYATIDGSATDGSDFTAQTGTITFTPTSKSFDIDVPILDDSVIEPQEAFSVPLPSPPHPSPSTSTCRSWTTA